MLYPGSIERTSLAERDEPKGYMTLDVEPGEGGGRLADWAFHELPARPMIDLDIDPTGLDSEQLAKALGRALAELDPDAVVRLRLANAPEGEAKEALKAAAVRDAAPETMTVSVPVARARRDGPPPRLESVRNLESVYSSEPRSG